MAKRRANGEGNLRKRKDGRWEGRYTAGRDPETGRAIYKNVLGKTQAEAKAKLKQAIEEAKGLDAAKLRRYLSERSKILPRRTTGTCAMHQRQLTEAIKRARQIALLPYVTE